MPNVSNRLRRNYGRSNYPTQKYMERANTKYTYRHPQRGAHIAAATIGQAFQRAKLNKYKNKYRRNQRMPLLRLRQGTGRNLGAANKLPMDILRDVLSYVA